VDTNDEWRAVYRPLKKLVGEEEGDLPSDGYQLEKCVSTQEEVDAFVKENAHTPTSGRKIRCGTAVDNIATSAATTECESSVVEGSLPVFGPLARHRSASSSSPRQSITIPELSLGAALTQSRSSPSFVRSPLERRYCKECILG